MHLQVPQTHFTGAISTSDQHRHGGRRHLFQFRFHNHHAGLHPPHAKAIPPTPITSRRGLLMSTVGDLEYGTSGGEMGVTRILFCGSSYPIFHNYTREYLDKCPDHSIKVNVVPQVEVASVIDKYHICVVKAMKLTSDIIFRAKQMKLIMQFGVGLDGVDIDAATECGIKVARIPSISSGNALSCAEMAIYLMLCLLRKQNEMQTTVNLRKLGGPTGDTLFGKTVFIMGFGSIGLELAKRIKPFGVQVIATKRKWDPSNSQQSNQMNDISMGGDNNLVQLKGGHGDRYKFASIADLVVCCLPLNSETVGIVNESFLSSMKKGSYLINVGRGGLLNYNDTIRTLTSGQLGGLGMDVAWNEPFDPADPILKLPNVILTPHVAGVTELSCRLMAKRVGDVALQLQRGDPFNGIEIVN